MIRRATIWCLTIVLVLGPAAAQDTNILAEDASIGGFQPMKWTDNLYLTAASVANPARLDSVAVVNVFSPTKVLDSSGVEALSAAIADGSLAFASFDEAHWTVLGSKAICAKSPDLCATRSEGFLIESAELQSLSDSGDLLLVSTDKAALGVAASSKLITWAYQAAAQ